VIDSFFQTVCLTTFSLIFLPFPKRSKGQQPTCTYQKANKQHTHFVHAKQHKKDTFDPTSAKGKANYDLLPPHPVPFLVELAVRTTQKCSRYVPTPQRGVVFFCTTFSLVFTFAAFQMGAQLHWKLESVERAIPHQSGKVENTHPLSHCHPFTTCVWAKRLHNTYLSLYPQVVLECVSTFPTSPLSGVAD